MPFPRPAPGGLGILLLAAATGVLYHPLRGLFFTKDDPAILAHVLARGVASGFVSPEAWQAHNRLFFTPLLNASLGADLAVWGLRAAPYYVHHVAAILAAAILLFWILARSAPRPVALAAAGAFLAGAPVAEVATQLMSRHYLEGLVVSLAAILAWTAPGEASSRRLALLAALLCVVAAAAKEVFLPLPLLLLLLPGPGRTGPFRIGAALSALGVSLGWRLAMLGALGKTYAPAHLEIASLASNARAFAAALPEALLGLPGGISPVVLAALLLGGVPFLVRRGRAPAGLGAFVLFAAPVLPVAAWIGISSRYVLVGWTLLTALCGLSAGALWSRGVRGRLGAVVLLGGLLAAALAGGRARFARELATAGRESAEGRFFLGSRPGDQLVDPAAPIWYFRGLERLRARFGPAGGTGTVANDALAFCGEAARGTRRHEYSAPLRSVVAEGPVAAAAREAACRDIVEEPLGLDLSIERGELTWEFEPRDGGTYGLVFLVPAYRFDLPRKGRHHLQWPPYDEEVAVRARWASPEGRVTYGPELRARLADGRARLPGSGL